MSGSVPFVDAARIFALAAGVAATNTVRAADEARRSARHSRRRDPRLVRRVRIRSAPAPARTASPRGAGDADGDDANPNVVAARHAARSRPAHPEGGDAADPQDAAAPRARLSGMSFGAAIAAALARPARRTPRRRRWVVVDTETSGLDPDARPTPRDRRGRGGRRRHPARRQLRSHRDGRAVRRCRQHRRPRDRTRRAGGGDAGARRARRISRLGRPMLPAWAFTPISTARCCARPSPARACRPTTGRGSTSRRSPGRWCREAYRYGGRSLDDWLAGLRHRMLDPPQRGVRRARHRRAPAAPARHRRGTGTRRRSTRSSTPRAGNDGWATRTERRRAAPDPVIHWAGTGLVMETLRRIVYLVFRPTAEWDAIAKEKTSVDALLRCYILPLALLAPIATVIGMKTFDRDWDPVHGYLVPADQILGGGHRDLFRDRRLDPRPRRDLHADRADVRRRARLPRGAQGRDLRRDPRDARRGDAAAARDGDRHDGRAVPHALPLVGRRAAGAACPARSRRPSSSGISLVLLTFLSVLVGAACSAVGLL